MPTQINDNCNLITIVDITDPNYFCNRSWTVSFNLNVNSWISFHSYLPNFYIGENNFYYSGMNGLCGYNALAAQVLPPTTTVTTTLLPRPITTTTTTRRLVFTSTTTSTSSTSSTSTSTTSSTTTVLLNCSFSGIADVVYLTTTTTSSTSSTTTSTTTVAPDCEFDGTITFVDECPSCNTYIITNHSCCPYTINTVDCSSNKISDTLPVNSSTTLCLCTELTGLPDGVTSVLAGTGCSGCICYEFTNTTKGDLIVEYLDCLTLASTSVTVPALNKAFGCVYYGNGDGIVTLPTGITALPGSTCSGPQGCNPCTTSTTTTIGGPTTTSTTTTIACNCIKFVNTGTENFASYYDCLDLITPQTVLIPGAIGSDPGILNVCGVNPSSSIPEITYEIGNPCVDVGDGYECVIYCSCITFTNNLPADQTAHYDDCFGSINVPVVVPGMVDGVIGTAQVCGSNPTIPDVDSMTATVGGACIASGTLPTTYSCPPSPTTTTTTTLPPCYCTTVIGNNSIDSTSTFTYIDCDGATITVVINNGEVQVFCGRNLTLVDGYINSNVGEPCVLRDSGDVLSMQCPCNCVTVSSTGTTPIAFSYVDCFNQYNPVNTAAPTTQLCGSSIVLIDGPGMSVNVGVACPKIGDVYACNTDCCNYRVFPPSIEGVVELYEVDCDGRALPVREIYSGDPVYEFCGLKGQSYAIYNFSSYAVNEISCPCTPPTTSTTTTLGPCSSSSFFNNSLVDDDIQIVSFKNCLNSQFENHPIWPQTSAGPYCYVNGTVTFSSPVISPVLPIVSCGLTTSTTTAYPIIP